MNQLSAAIKSARTAHGLTQEQLGGLAGIHDSMVSKIEKGKTTGSMQTLTRIAAALGVTLADLVSGHPGSPPGPADS